MATQFTIDNDLLTVGAQALTLDEIAGVQSDPDHTGDSAAAPPSAPPQYANGRARRGLTLSARPYRQQDARRHYS
jgi:hypothetical protein